MLRNATLEDKGAIETIARGQSGRYPRLRYDCAKVHEALKTTIPDPRHYTKVVEKDGQVVAVLLGLTGDNLWAQRQNCNIVLWVSHLPGAGSALLRDFRDWVKAGRYIRVAGMHPDIELDPRALSLAERIGFKKHGGAYLLYN